MNEILIFVAPITGLFGVLFGAAIQAWFTRKNQDRNFLNEQRNKAYADFLNAASKIAVSQRLGNSNEVTDALAQLADSKSRICIYGDTNVIEKMAAFLRNGGTLQTESEIIAFTQLSYAMRKSVGFDNSKMNIADISQLLFSIDVKDTMTPKRVKTG